MIIGVEDGECYLASDVPAILKYTRKVYYIGNLEIGRLQKGNVTFYNIDGEEIEKELKEVTWDAEAAEKGGYEHFMMKEIHEQPKAVSDTINSVVKDGVIDLTAVGLTEEQIRDISQIYIVACGSAYHVGCGGSVRDRGSGENPCAGGTGVGIPLPQAPDGSKGAGHQRAISE